MHKTKKNILFCILVIMSILLVSYNEFNLSFKDTGVQAKNLGSDINDKSSPRTPPSTEDLKSLAINAEKCLKTLFNKDNFSAPYFQGGKYALIKNFRTKEEILFKLKENFTEKTSEEIFNNFCLEYQGKLYVKVGQGGMRVDYNSTSEIRVENKETALQVSYKQILGDETLVQSSELVYERGKWLFNNYWYI